MDRPYYAVPARAFFAQCFAFEPRQVSTRYWGRGGAGLAGVTALCQRHRAGARAGAQVYRRCEDRVFRGLICKVDDYRNSVVGLRVIRR